MQSTLHKLVVVGGGAGGLELVTNVSKTLGRKGLTRQTLVDGYPTHIWKPLLHEVATGALNTGEDELNYFSHGYSTGYEFRLGFMNGLDTKKKVIKIAPIKDYDGQQVGGPKELRYDTLVIAVGAVSNFFGTPGVAEQCIWLDTHEDADNLRKRILSQLMCVVMGTSPVPKLRIGIVGAGATGVELAAEIHHTICVMRSYGAKLLENQLEITIIEGGPRILGGGHESLSKFAAAELEKRQIEIRTNTVIKSVNANGFEFQDGTRLDKDIKVWTAGIKAPDWLGGLGLQVNRINQIKVNEYLQSVDDPNIFVIGDCAWASFNKDPKRNLPATAQVAHQEAEWLTKHLEAKLTNRSIEAFIFKPQGMLVSLGSTSAVGSLSGIVGPKGGFYVEGKGAKVLYSSLYRMHQAVLYGRTRAGLLWVGDKLRRVALPQLKLH